MGRQCVDSGDSIGSIDIEDMDGSFTGAQEELITHAQQRGDCNRKREVINRACTQFTQVVYTSS